MDGIRKDPWIGSWNRKGILSKSYGDVTKVWTLIDNAELILIHRLWQMYHTNIKC